MKYRTFTSKDQIAFAELSGDYNPIHIDAVAARRLLFGSPIVHGIHSLLWGLDSCLEDRAEYLELRSIKADFPKPIRVGEEVSLTLMQEDDECLSIKLLCGRSVVAKIQIELHKSVRRNFDYIESSFPKKRKPRVLLDKEIAVDSGALDLHLNVDRATTLFPHLIRCISPLQIAVILSTTRLVGSMCPGLHSLYSSIDLSATIPTEKTTMSYEVTKFDKRFGLIRMKIIAPDIAGNIEAFLRPVPEKQASYQTLKHQVDSNEFAGQRALVIGGSRGLGEVAAKLLSGGGADVKITYHQGKEDAQRIVDDIVSNGGVADCFHFDVLDPKIDPTNISIDHWVPTHLYYFATPLISGVKGVFSPQLFRKFCDYYVVGFINTVNQVREFGVRRIFYPSTVFIDELPTNMGEYATAKSAGEVLCTLLEKTNREMTIYNPRFPKVATDQTSSIMPVLNQDPAPIMIMELRSFEQSVRLNDTMSVNNPKSRRPVSELELKK